MLVRFSIQLIHDLNTHTTHSSADMLYNVKTIEEKSFLVTLTDRYSRFLKIQKVAVKKSKLVIEAMVQMLEPLPEETVTPDRGKEFTNHQDLTDKLKV